MYSRSGLPFRLPRELDEKLVDNLLHIRLSFTKKLKPFSCLLLPVLELLGE